MNKLKVPWKGKKHRKQYCFCIIIAIVVGAVMTKPKNSIKTWYTHKLEP